MEKFFQWLSNTFKGFLKIFLFLISCLIILYFFPREGKFPYEFQKGKPWQHQTYFAPFDFPIYKSTEELASEKDTLLKNFKPYYNLDNTITNSNISLLDENFRLEWDNYFGNDTLKEVQKIKQKFKPKELKFFKDSCLKLLKNLFEEIYSNGIIDIDNEGFQVINQYSTIIKIVDNIGKEQNSYLVNTPKSSYEIILNRVNEVLTSEKFSKYSFALNFIDKLNINNYLEPNLFYDASKTNADKENLINSISLTKGMVQENERIIIQGDIVNDQNFRILESLKISYQIKLGVTNYYLVLAGQFVLLSFCFLVLYLFLLNFRKEVLNNNLNLSFILLLIIIFSIISGVFLESEKLNEIEYLSVYCIPVAIIPILIWTFFDSRLAIFVHIITILIIGFIAPNSFEYILLNFISGVVAIFSLKNFYRRSKMFLTSGLVIFTYYIIYFVISIIQNGNIDKINWYFFSWFGINGILVIFSYPLIYFSEKTFGFLSDYTLMELSDTNQPLLRQLAEKAPGTFQHSLQVANLAEEAIIEIGGNPLLIRTGALYHDIGKIEEPVYFTENQRLGFNPHENLDYENSAEIIVKHIEGGVKIAKKHNLPNQIIDFIKTHQGTGKIEYFYRLFKNKFPDEIPDMNKFSYPGPKPFSKETAVLMMADSVEAASKSLKEVNAQTLSDLVDEIIQKQIDENQFDYADITFKDITAIKNVFKRKLLNIYHVRIEYPKEK